MLNKEVCWKCKSKRFKGASRDQFDYRWEKRQIVTCPVGSLPLVILFIHRSEPPPQCPYILEHVVNQTYLDTR